MDEMKDQFLKELLDLWGAEILFIFFSPIFVV